MHKKFEINRTKIKGRKVVPHDSKSDLPLDFMGFGERLPKLKGKIRYNMWKLPYDVPCFSICPGF